MMMEVQQQEGSEQQGTGLGGWAEPSTCTEELMIKGSRMPGSGSALDPPGGGAAHVAAPQGETHAGGGSCKEGVEGQEFALRGDGGCTEDLHGYRGSKV